REQPLEDLDGGRLARPVRPEQAEALTRPGLEVEPIHRHDVLVALDQPAAADRRGTFGRILHPGKVQPCREGAPRRNVTCIRARSGPIPRTRPTLTESPTLRRRIADVAAAAGAEALAVALYDYRTHET